MLARMLLLVSFALPLFAQSNAELARIYDEDQRDRADWFHLTKKQQRMVARRDAPRRARVGEMVRGGVLKTGEDFERASFIFQHGDKLDDYVMAHVLAMTASAVEPFRGRWISAATFDRMLYFTHRPQVFGLGLSDKLRFDKELLSDSIRELNCVPSVAVRERQLREIAEKKTVTIPGPCNAQPELWKGKWGLTLRSPDGALSQATFEFDPESGVVLTEAGRAMEPDQMTMDDRGLRFQVGERSFQLRINGEEMTGSFSAAGGGTGRVVGLMARGAK